METKGKEQATVLSEEDVNIYEDLCDYDLGEEVEKLKTENKKLEELIHSLQGDIERLNGTIAELKETQNNLTKNISALFITAKAEIERKNRMIEELRGQIENQHANKLNPEYNKRKERDSSPFETNKCKKFKNDDGLSRNETIDYDIQKNKPNDTRQESRSTERLKRLSLEDDSRQQTSSRYSQDRYNDQFDDIRYESWTRHLRDRYNECDRYDSRSKYYNSRRSTYEEDGHYSISNYPYDEYYYRRDGYDFDNRYERDDTYVDRSGRNHNRNFFDRKMGDREKYREEIERHNKYTNESVDHYTYSHYRNDQKLMETSHCSRPEPAPVPEIEKNTDKSPSNSRPVTPMPLPDDIEIPSELPKEKPPKKRLKMLEKMEKKVKKNRLFQTSNSSFDNCDSSTTKIVHKSKDLLRVARDSESDKHSVTSSKSTASNKSDRFLDLFGDEPIKYRIPKKNNTESSKNVRNEKLNSKNLQGGLKLAPDKGKQKLDKDTNNLLKTNKALKKYDDVYEKDKQTVVTKQNIDGIMKTNSKKLNKKNLLEMLTTNKSQEQATKLEVSIDVAKMVMSKQEKPEERQKLDQQSKKQDENFVNKKTSSLFCSEQDLIIVSDLNKIFGETEDCVIENVNESTQDVYETLVESKSNTEENSWFEKLVEKMKNIAAVKIETTGEFEDKSVNEKLVVHQKSCEQNKFGEKIRTKSPKVNISKQDFVKVSKHKNVEEKKEQWYSKDGDVKQIPTTKNSKEGETKELSKNKNSSKQKSEEKTEKQCFKWDSVKQGEKNEMKLKNQKSENKNCKKPTAGESQDKSVNEKLVVDQKSYHQSKSGQKTQEKSPKENIAKQGFSQAKDKDTSDKNLDYVKFGTHKNAEEKSEHRCSKEDDAKKILKTKKSKDETEEFPNNQNSNQQKSEEKTEKSCFKGDVVERGEKTEIRPKNQKNENKNCEKRSESEEAHEKKSVKEVAKQGIFEDPETKNEKEKNIDEKSKHDKSKENNSKEKIAIQENVDGKNRDINSEMMSTKEIVEEEKSTRKLCLLEENKECSKENSKEKVIASKDAVTETTENVIGRRSERIMKQNQKRLSVESPIQSEKEDKKQESVKSTKKNEEQSENTKKSEKETEESPKKSMKVMRDYETNEIAEILLTLNNETEVKSNTSRPENICERTEDIKKEITQRSLAESVANPTEDTQHKRRKSMLIEPMDTHESETEISLEHSAKPEPNKNGDKLGTHNKKSQQEKIILEKDQTAKVKTEVITDGKISEIILETAFKNLRTTNKSGEHSLKQNINESEQASKEKSDEAKIMQMEIGPRNRVREVKRKIRFSSIESTLNDNISNKVIAGGESGDNETNLKIKQSATNLMKDGESHKKIVDCKGKRNERRLSVASVDKADTTTNNTIVSKDNKNDSLQKNKRQTSTNRKVSVHSSPEDATGLAISSKTDDEIDSQEESLDISLNSGKTMDKRIEINNVKHEKIKKADSILSSDSSTSEDTVVMCTADKKNIIDDKLDKLLKQYMDNFGEEDIGSESRKIETSGEKSEAAVEKNIKSESSSSSKEISPETCLPGKSTEPKIKVLRIVSISSSSCEIQNNISSTVENLVISDTTITANSNTSASCVESQKVISDIVKTKRRRITPTPVRDDKQCSFENILTNTCQPDNFATTTAMESPLHLTHEGEIPVLHLEENQLNNLPTEANLNDKNIINLLESMNISNIDCDTTKFKNISVVSETTVNSTVVSGNGNGLSFENIIDKVTSTPIASKKNQEVAGRVNSISIVSSSSSSNVGQPVSPNVTSGTTPFQRRRRRCRLVIRD